MAGKGRGGKRGGGRKGGKRGGVRKARFAKGISQPDMGSITCSTNLSNLSTNTMYQRLNTALDQFSRAVTTAVNFQFYKITGITMKFQPRLDTYIGGGTSTVPYLYYMLDKSGSLPSTVTVGNLVQMGAKPIRFDDKTVTVKWRPSVITDVATAPGGAPGNSAPAQYRISPWLNTNANFVTPGVWAPSSVDHLGIYWMVETSGSNSLYDVVLTVDFQFKKPLVQVSGSAPLATAV